MTTVFVHTLNGRAVSGDNVGKQRLAHGHVQEQVQAQPMVY